MEGKKALREISILEEHTEETLIRSRTKRKVNLQSCNTNSDLVDTNSNTILETKLHLRLDAKEEDSYLIYVRLGFHETNPVTKNNETQKPRER